MKKSNELVERSAHLYTIAELPWGEERLGKKLQVCILKSGPNREVDDIFSDINLDKVAICDTNSEHDGTNISFVFDFITNKNPQLYSLKKYIRKNHKKWAVGYTEYIFAFIHFVVRIPSGFMLIRLDAENGKERGSIELIDFNSESERKRNFSDDTSHYFILLK
jgi:hypothetical protein